MNRLHFLFIFSSRAGARRRAFGQPCGTSSLEPAAKEADADPRGDRPSKQ
jgi:hypothetical protein